MGVSTRVYTVFGVKQDSFNTELSGLLYETDEYKELRRYVVGDAMGGSYTVIGKVLFDSGDSRWGSMSGFEVIELKDLFPAILEIRQAFSRLPQHLTLLDAKWHLMTFVHCS